MNGSFVVGAILMTYRLVCCHHENRYIEVRTGISMKIDFLAVSKRGGYRYHYST